MLNPLHEWLTGGCEEKENVFASEIGLSLGNPVNSKFRPASSPKFLFIHIHVFDFSDGESEYFLVNIFSVNPTFLGEVGVG